MHFELYRRLRPNMLSGARQRDHLLHYDGSAYASVALTLKKYIHIYFHNAGRSLARCRCRVHWPKPAHKMSSGAVSVACNISADGNNIDVGKQTQNDTCDA